MKQTIAMFLVALVLILGGRESRARDLRDIIPGLYGGDGITLAPASGHSPHFTVASAASINRLNSQISGEIAIFPFSSSQGGFTYAFDPGQSTFVRTTQTLGPMFAEKAATLGRGKLNFNASYTFYNFDRFQGEELSDLRVTAGHQADSIGNPNVREGFEEDTLLITLDLDIRVRLFTLAATYGVTDNLDVGILVPIVNVKFRVKSNARIINSPDNPTPEVHTFAGALDNPFDEASGDATGIGDIVLRAKYHLLSSEIVDVSGAVLTQLGTGDASNFLGRGSTSIRPFLILSRTFFNVFTPHINLGYEVTVDRGNRNSFEYVAGFEVGSEQFTASLDLLGSHRFRSENIGRDLLTGSLGVKWNPFRQFVLALNAQIPLNDSGLRSNLITTLGVEYSF